jgi:hypothetical protein
MMRSIPTILVALILLAISALVAHAAVIAFGGGLVMLMFSDAPNSPRWIILLQFLVPLLWVAPVGLAWFFFISRAQLSALACGIAGAFGAGCYLYFLKDFKGIFAFLLM